MNYNIDFCANCHDLFQSYKREAEKKLELLSHKILLNSEIISAYLQKKNYPGSSSTKDDYYRHKRQNKKIKNESQEQIELHLEKELGKERRSLQDSLRALQSEKEKLAESLSKMKRLLQDKTKELEKQAKHFKSVEMELNDMLESSTSESARKIKSLEKLNEIQVKRLMKKVQEVQARNSSLEAEHSHKLKEVTHSFNRRRALLRIKLREKGFLLRQLREALRLQRSHMKIPKRKECGQTGTEPSPKRPRLTEQLEKGFVVEAAAAPQVFLILVKLQQMAVQLEWNQMERRVLASYQVPDGSLVPLASFSYKLDPPTSLDFSMGEAEVDRSTDLVLLNHLIKLLDESLPRGRTERFALACLLKKTAKEPLRVAATLAFFLGLAEDSVSADNMASHVTAMISKVGEKNSSVLLHSFVREAMELVCQQDKGEVAKAGLLKACLQVSKHMGLDAGYFVVRKVLSLPLEEADKLLPLTCSAWPLIYHSSVVQDAISRRDVNQEVTLCQLCHLLASNQEEGGLVAGLCQDLVYRLTADGPWLLWKLLQRAVLPCLYSCAKPRPLVAMLRNLAANHVWYEKSLLTQLLTPYLSMAENRMEASRKPPHSFLDKPSGFWVNQD